MASSRDLSSLFKALAHPERVAILQSLQGKELCVCELEKALDLRQSYVSQQLSVLREAGLVCWRKKGWNVLYRISRPEVYAHLDEANAIHEHLGVCAVTPEALASGVGACESHDLVEAEEAR